MNLTTFFQWGLDHPDSAVFSLSMCLSFSLLFIGLFFRWCLRPLKGVDTIGQEVEKRVNSSRERATIPFYLAWIVGIVGSLAVIPSVHEETPTIVPVIGGIVTFVFLGITLRRRSKGGRQ